MQFTTTTVLALVASASAATIKVKVGDGALVYAPNDIKAAVGDSVEFSFFPKNHTVTQSSFSDPCHPLANGFFSGFVPTNASTLGSTFTISITDTKPIWIYCGQTTGSHCQSGMTAAINAPSTGNTFAAFQNLAKNATLSTSPSSGPVGGIFVKSSGSGNGTTSGSSSSSAGSSATGKTGSTTLVSSSYTSTYSTTAVQSTLVTSAYTSNGVVYSTTYASSYTTAYPTTVTSAAVSTSTAPAPTGAANGNVVKNLGAVGAVVFGVLAMV
ncbi:Cupredoxin [Tricladium varicosporioides]|nr:Cupredoxin [Hymenoscyphus varicosporioides]